MYDYKAILEKQSQDILIILEDSICSIINSLKVHKSFLEYINKKCSLSVFVENKELKKLFKKFEEIIDTKEVRSDIFEILALIRCQSFRYLNILKIYINKGTTCEVKEMIIKKILEDIKVDSNYQIKIVESTCLSGSEIFCASYKGLFIKYSIVNLINKLIKTGYNKSIWRVIEKI